MKKLLLALGLLLAASLPAGAQCIGVGGVNNAPFPGMTCDMEPIVDSFGATAVGVALASSATDVACITGSSSKIIRVQRIGISGIAGILNAVPVTVTKHATANTGGTAGTSAAALVAYAMDSTDTAATATIQSYTANPTITDAAPGVIAGRIIPFVTSTGATPSTTDLIDYRSRRYNEAPTLRSTAQQICVNLNGNTVTGGSATISMEWTEAAQ